ncbi:protein kinase [Streptomyces sp. NBC_00083]|uniref:serine/threonine-protein kinase n=1 Tax=Streptomyces sp. NBC_00083 TaxID=2975647 RepID=UPI00225B9E61|nr:serine/threonine-protein kinase [Streptomyces sp. NBC_00083]MCX5381955.1 serine/threonine-protein kinase [Streptomyces sp. NBC_00083]
MQRLGDADPRTAGPYALVGRLGAGGMGAVYLGRSAGGRTVAVKVVRPELANDAGFRDRFRREVAAARRVSGAFTAPVLDADTDADVPWMATAFVVGVSLHEAVAAHGPLPKDALLMLTAGLAEALTAVHGARVIHRDLKPGNVLLALDGPRVIDFGIARATDGTALTSTGAVIGSAPYMSPEQATGQPLTAASDLFALGSTVAFAAGGRSPFGDGGAAAGVLFRVVHTEPDLDALPPELRPLIARCLAKEPRERPTPREVIDFVERGDRTSPHEGWLPGAVAADVLAVRAVMTALPAPEPTRVLDPPTQDLRGGSSGRGPGRRNLILGLAAGALAAAGVGTAVALNGDGSGSDGGASSGVSGRPAGARSRPSGNDVTEAKVAWQVKQPATCPQVVSAGGVVACVSLNEIWGLDDQGRTRWSVKGPDHGVQFSVQGPTPKAIAAVDGGRLYVAALAAPTAADLSFRSTVLGLGLSDGKDVWTAGLDTPPTMGAMFLPGIRDGKAYVAVMLRTAGSAATPTGYGIWALDLASRKTAWFHGGEPLLAHFALPPAGDRMLIGDTGHLKGLDAKGAEAWTQSVTSAAVGAVGRYGVVVDTSGTLTVLDPATGKKVWSMPGVEGAALRGGVVAANPDGSVLYALLADGDGGLTLAALDTANGTKRWTAPLPLDGTKSSTVRARLLYADKTLYRMDSTAVVWACDPADGRPLWKYTGLRGTDPANLAWAAGDGRLCISDTAATTVAALHANGA